MVRSTHKHISSQENKTREECTSTVAYMDAMHMTVNEVEQIKSEKDQRRDTYNKFMKSKVRCQTLDFIQSLYVCFLRGSFSVSISLLDWQVCAWPPLPRP